MRIETVELPQSTYINPFKGNPVKAVKELTADGGAVVFEQNNLSGESIDLKSYEDSGWITFGTLKSLEALSAVTGAEYLLTLDDGTAKRVRFRHEDCPALDMTPVIERPAYSGGDYFYGTIKLAEVK